MPGHSMHMLSATYFLNALRKESPELEEAIHHNFMLGQILPDLSPWSPTDHRTGHIDIRHFRDPDLEDSKYSHGIILLSDLIEAKRYLMRQKRQKKHDIKTRAYLAGIFFHLCLDNYFFTDYLYPRFMFTGEKVINCRTGRSYLPNDFISKKGIGIYNVWDCMTALTWGELLVERNQLPEILPPSGFPQYDNFRSIEYWKKDMETFASSANFSQTAIDIDYFDVHDYLTYFAHEMNGNYHLMDFLKP